MKNLLLTFLALVVFSTVASAQSQLSPAQADALKKIKADAEKTAAPYAMKLAVTVKKIYANMMSKHEDQRLRRRLAAEMHAHTARLLDIKGDTFRLALKVLSADQKQLLREAVEKPDAPQDMGELIEKTFNTPD